MAKKKSGGNEETNAWIASMVRSVMNQPPIELSAGPLTCPVCDCDHQQFRGLGVFHPSKDGTKLVTTFPTADLIATIDLPKDIKVGGDTLYMRYECLCNGHHWAEVVAWHEDHTVSWCVELAKEKVPKGIPKNFTHTLPPAEQAPPLAEPATPVTPSPAQAQASMGPLYDMIVGAANNPLVKAIAGGQMLPVLVLPIPILVNPTGQPPVAPQHYTQTPEQVEQLNSKKSFETAPNEANVYWTSWNKKVVSIKTEIMFPVMPDTKGPHFYVANGDVKSVESRRIWVMRMALDVPEETASHVYAYILWHDRLVLVLDVPKVSMQIKTEVMAHITQALTNHDDIRVQGVGMYRKADYTKFSNQK